MNDSADAAFPLDEQAPAPALPAGHGLDRLDFVYISAGVVRDLAAGFGEAGPYPTIASGARSTPCSER